MENNWKKRTLGHFLQRLRTTVSGWTYYRKQSANVVSNCRYIAAVARYVIK